MTIVMIIETPDVVVVDLCDWYDRSLIGDYAPVSVAFDELLAEAEISRTGIRFETPSVCRSAR